MPHQFPLPTLKTRSLPRINTENHGQRISMHYQQNCHTPQKQIFWRLWGFTLYDNWQSPGRHSCQKTGTIRKSQSRAGFTWKHFARLHTNSAWQQSTPLVEMWRNFEKVSTERYISLPSTALDVTSRDLNLELGRDLIIQSAFQSPNTVIFLSWLKGSNSIKNWACLGIYLLYCESKNLRLDG